VRRTNISAEPAEIEAFCLTQLARYKVPREYIWLDDLPRNAMGKVQHFRLKEMLAKGTLAAHMPETLAAEPAADEARAGGRWKWLLGRA
jgi:acyl-CoA synthetase (AMP-forming)/AMP-acid ligase II